MQQLCVQLPTSADNVTLLVYAADRCAPLPAAEINRYRLPVGPTYCGTLLQRLIDGQTDVRTPYRCMDRAAYVRVIGEIIPIVSSTANLS